MRQLRFAARLASLCLAIVVAVGATIGSAWAQSAPASANVNPPPPLRMLTIERQPFAMMQKGQLVGFSVELWKEVARELGVTYEFKVMTSFGDMLKNVAEAKSEPVPEICTVR